MATSTIYYSRSFQPSLAALEALLVDTAHTFAWQSFDTLSETPVSALVLLVEADLYQREIPLLASRKVLLLSHDWSFYEATQWLKVGVKDSMGLTDEARIGAWVMADLARSEFTFVTQQSAQTMLQNVIDAIPVPIFYKDEHHVYRGCNQAFSDFIGLPLSKIIDHSVYDVAPKELADIYYRADVMLLTEGGVQSYEAACQTPEGVRDIEFNKAVFYKSNREKGGQVGVMLDVTERNHLMKQVEQASRTDPLTGIGNRREFDICVDDANIKPLTAGNTGVQMGGWFNKEINSLDDFNGLKMRIPGLGGEVLEKLGGSPINLPGGEIFTALQTGTIDATEWVGPYNDLAFGLYKAADYYYYPGWHEPGSEMELLVNKDAYEALPNDLQAIVRAASRQATQDMLDEFTALNNDALQTLVNEHNVDLRPFPEDVLKALRQASQETLAEVAARDELSQRVYDSFNTFLGKVSEWHHISERAYINARDSE